MNSFPFTSSWGARADYYWLEKSSANRANYRKTNASLGKESIVGPRQTSRKVKFEFDKIHEIVSDMPFEKEDEELRMLREWIRRLAEARGGKRRPSGLIVQSVVREHLLESDFNVSLNNVRINSFDGKHHIPVHLLVLNNGVPRNEKLYSPDEIRFVIEIRSNAVKIAEKIKEKFDEIEANTRLDRFVVVVLSETKEHVHEITREKIGDKNRNVFTLFGRKNYPWGEFSEEMIDEKLASGEMWKTGQWERFLDHLRN